MRSGSVADLPVSREVREAIAAFVASLKGEGRGRVGEVVVFGSVVRGEYGRESDVDILVHWNGRESEARDMLARIATDILADYGVEVSAFPMDQAHWDHAAALGTRFHTAVEAEGVRVEG